MTVRRASLAAAGAILLGATSVAAIAQDTTSEPGAGYVEQDKDEFPWGLLGLLGLAGLLGMKRNDDRRMGRDESATTRAR